jgi:hypothetical protein
LTAPSAVRSNSDAITAACDAVRLGSCDDAIAQQLRIAAFLAQNDM